MNKDNEEIINKTYVKKRILRRIHFSFYARVIFLSIVLVSLLITSYYSFNKFIKKIDATEIKYKETGKINYKVYLKQNDFYDNDYLSENMVYVANLIDKIAVTFDYNLDLDTPIDNNFIYDITAKLEIKDSKTHNVFYEKDYILLPSVTKTIKETNLYDIKESIDIDYNYYNALANSFKSLYSVSPDSNLIISLNLKKDNEYLNANDKMTLTIPLSEKSINISMSPMGINNQKMVLTEEEVVIGNVTYLIIFIASILLSLIILLRLVMYLDKLVLKKNKYQRELNRILQVYDRLVAEIKTLPNFDECNILKVPSFKELVDIRDNLKIPIMFYEIVKNQKCYFFIKDDKDIYLYVLKDADLTD